MIYFQQQVDTIYSKYPPDTKKRSPRLHPAVQLIGSEFKAAHMASHQPNWSGLTLSAVHQLCEQQTAMYPGWHPDINARTLNTYFGEIHPNALWYNFVPQVAAPTDDGAHT